MNEVAEISRQGTAVTVPGGNAFEDYGNAASQKSIVGDILKFTKFGEWVSGNETELEKGTKLIANMDELLIGWVRWEDSKPTEQIMGKVADGHKPARRSEMGDNDESLWEIDNGKPKDPWQLTNYLVLKEESGDQLYTYATSSKSGISAVGELCKLYGKQMRQRPDEYPIVELQASNYVHDKYGKIFTPVLSVFGWAGKSSFADIAAEEETAAPAAKAKNGGKSARF